MSQFKLAVIGIDIGKNSFHVVGQDERGSIVLRQKWSRGQVDARFANLPPYLIGMEACVGAHHLSRKLQVFGHDARLMPAKYVRPYSKGQKNDFRDAEAIAEAVQRPTMKFVATKIADQLDLQALHRVRERLVSQRTGVINQIRAFLLERGIAVRQGLRFLRTELPIVLAVRSDVLSPRMLRLVEDLAGDWRLLDARIEAVSGEIEVLARQDQACERLMSVPSIGPIISSAIVAAIGTGDAFSKGRDFGAWLGLVPKQISTGTERSLAASPSAATAIYAPYSCRPRGSSWSSWGRSGSGMGSGRGSRRQRGGCITTCWLLHSPTSSPASPGRFSTEDPGSNVPTSLRCRRDPTNPRAVLGPVKAWPGTAKSAWKDPCDGQPCRPLRAARLRPQVGTKERSPSPNKGTDRRYQERSMT
jgi:transposase